MATGALEAILVSPAPWSLTGEGWIIPFHAPFSDEPVPLPEGACAPLERGSKADPSGRFHGGLGMVLVVRYASSDVGPYDELMYIPGLCSRPDKRTKKACESDFALSISRIYVSTDASVANGRRNWSIPKHRAVFDFSTSSSGRTTLSVSHPSSPLTPFFRCALRPSRLMPVALPVRTSWLSSRVARACMAGYAPALVQPPLPGATSQTSDVQETGQRIDALVASEKAYRVEPSASGWARALVVEPFPEDDDERDWSRFGDGVSFPKFQPCGSRMSVQVQGLEMGFPVPEELDGWV